MATFSLAETTSTFFRTVRSLLIVVGKEGHLFSGLQQALHVPQLMDIVEWGSQDKFASLIYAV